MEFSKALQIEGEDRARSWLGSLLTKEIVYAKGQTRATEYYIAPNILRSTQFRGRTTLKPIQDHRLEELIRTDLNIYPNSSISEIQVRIGLEIPRYKLKRCLERLREADEVSMVGKQRWAKYSMAQPLPNTHPETDENPAP